MKRSMMQAYATRSDEAVALYQKAFDAILISSYTNHLHHVNSVHSWQIL